MIGVSADTQTGAVPDYSNRDAIYNDLAAPGDDIFSTIPTNLVTNGATCTDGPYSDCGPDEFHDAIGTSFAAPQVSAAAALLLGAGSEAHAGSGLVPARAHRRRCERVDRLQLLPARPRHVHRLGRARRECRADAARVRDAAAAARPLRAERRRRPVGASRSRRSRPRSRRRSTTGTTTSTSTASTCRRASSSSRGSHPAAAANVLAVALGARHAARRGPARRSRRIWSRAPARSAARSGSPIARRRPACTTSRRSSGRRRATRCSTASRSAAVRPELVRATSRSTRAGDPTTTTRGGTSFVTTAPAPTNASSPISMPGQRIAPPPIRAPRRIVGPFINARRFSVRPMKLSFVVTTHGAMKTSSSSVE